MTRAKIIRFAIHVRGVAVGSVLALLAWIVSVSIGWIPIISTCSRKLAASHAVFWAVVRFFGYVSEAMGYPFSFIRPGSSLDGPQVLIPLSLFSGHCILFIVLCVPYFDIESWPNKSPEPTAVGACSSAIAVHAASRRWLSFFR